MVVERGEARLASGIRETKWLVQTIGQIIARAA
jgi:hypothetical protein